MAQPGYAPVIYREVNVTGGTRTVSVGPILGTIDDLAVALAAAGDDDRIQVWTGRYFADVTAITSAGPGPIRSWSTSNGSYFIGIASSKVASSGILKTIASSLSVDTGFTYWEALTFTDTSQLTYKKTASSTGATETVLPNDEAFYISIDATDNIYWSGGFLVKAGLA